MGTEYPWGLHTHQLPKGHLPPPKVRSPMEGVPKTWRLLTQRMHRCAILWEGPRVVGILSLFRAESSESITCRGYEKALYGWLRGALLQKLQVQSHRKNEAVISCEALCVKSQCSPPSSINVVPSPLLLLPKLPSAWSDQWSVAKLGRQARSTGL